jgi:hypothetical protein
MYHVSCVIEPLTITNRHGCHARGTVLLRGGRAHEPNVLIPEATHMVDAEDVLAQWADLLPQLREVYSQYHPLGQLIVQAGHKLMPWVSFAIREYCE